MEINWETCQDLTDFPYLVEAYGEEAVIDILDCDSIAKIYDPKKRSTSN